MRFRSVLVILLLASVMSACASFENPMREKTAEEQVASLVEARHQAIRKRDYSSLYNFMTPGYRSSNDIRKFQLDYAGISKWTSLNIKKISCEESRCEVDVDIEYSYSRMGGSASQLGQVLTVPRTNTEIWIELDGNWWFFKNL